MSETTPKTARLRRFVGYLRPFRLTLVLLFGTILLSILITLPIPWLEKLVIDEAIPRRDFKQLLVLTAAIVGLYAAHRLFLFWRSYLSVKIKQSVLTAMRMRMYEHLQRMSLRFFARHPSGGLLSRITNDVGYVQNLLNDELFDVLSSAIKVLVTVGLLFAISTRLTLLCACVLPVLTIVFVLFKKRVYHENRRLQETQARLSARIQQNFSLMKLIQAEVIEQRMQQETLASSRKLERVGVKRELVGITGNLLTTLLSYAPLIGILWLVGGQMVIQATLTLGALLAFTQYLLGIVTPVTRFFQFNMNLQAGYAALDRIYEILDQPVEIEDQPGAQSLETPVERITFDRVSLTFATDGAEGQVTALRDVSFEIRRGETVAVVGPSGAGKTSLLHLLLRFHEPTAGQVRVNDRPLTSYTLHSLRSAMAYVPQETFLLDTAIRDNVTLDRPATEPALTAALELAAADGFVQEAGGLDLLVEQQGANLSGGQRQRLVLARSLLKDSSLYLLDEATAALDPQTEQRIIGNLGTFLADRTAIIIAHTPALLALADRILVFADGRLVEQGTREELTKRRGVFFVLHQANAAERAGPPAEEPQR